MTFRAAITFAIVSLWKFTLPAAERVDFQRQILPVLQAKCFDCHGADGQEGQLRLDAKAGVFHGGVSGPAVTAGDAGESPLFMRITSNSEDERMPLDEPPLPAEEIALIRRWIEEGAAWPDGVGVQVDPVARHWAYIAPQRPPLPKVGDASWTKNPIDTFVLARLERARLKPSPRANRARLLRRVYLDLIGLPPSVEELDAFLNDDTPRAYENAVDRLLASPRYGERWARPWLDLARYADSNGYQADQYRSVWPYRDWVINALNDDMPFDRFTIEQIAGDLLPGATVDQKIATGFHRLTTCNVEAGVDPEENRVNQIIDRVNTTGTVWLGTTIECAQCHNHKYDPFTQRDYYQLFAYFNNTPLEVEGNGVQFNFVGPKMSLPIPPEQQARCGQLQQQLDQFNEQLKSAVADKKKQLEKQITALKRQIAAIQPGTTLVMVEMDKPRRTHVFKRGSFLTQGESVQPGTPRILPQSSGAPPNRIGLAQWLVDEKNPLTARVAVNRWWAEMFGRGIVETIEDFGTQGEPPTHPDLLDWLACELVDGGWSMKHVHRWIVTSATYQQSARITPQLAKRDPYNKLYARGPRYRLPAETIRDNALAISGVMATKMGGPPVYPPQPAGIWRHVGRNAPKYDTSQGADRYRRGIYVVWRRSAPYPAFTNFDAPDRASCVADRPRTNTPVQALTLLNDEAFIELAGALAERIAAGDSQRSIDEKIVYGFRLCTSREPAADELQVLREFFDRELARLQSQPNAVKQLLANFTPSGNGQQAELAAWLLMANVLLNLDETITKG